MNPKKNSLCPCGSGKKYKRCCGDKNVSNRCTERSQIVKPLVKIPYRFEKILFLFLGALILRILPLVFGIESTDILLYKQQATPVIEWQNIYTVTKNVFPYTPVSMFYPAFCYCLSQVLKVPFHIVMKMPAIFSDTAIVMSLYLLGSKILTEKKAFLLAVLYTLNPVSILVSSFHGNIMSFVVLAMLLSYLYLSIDKDKNLTLSALLLGLAIGWRSFPILLLPFFLLELDSWKKRIIFFLYAMVPVGISVLPFLILDAGAMLKEMMGYSGWGIHHGPFAILRANYLISLDKITWRNPPEWEHFFSFSKVAFFVYYGAFFIFFRKLSLLAKIIAVFILFYLLYAGTASQYLIWVLPFLLFLDSKRFFYLYVGITTYALVVFYWTFFPDILFGSLDSPRVPLILLLHHYQISQCFFSTNLVYILLMIFLGKTQPLFDKLQVNQSSLI